MDNLGRRLSPPPSTPALASAAALTVALAVSATGCQEAAPPVGVNDAGISYDAGRIDAPAPGVPDAGVSDAPPPSVLDTGISDAPPLVIDAGIAAPDTGTP